MVKLFPERVKRLELTLKDSINTPLESRSSIVPEEPRVTASLKLITRLSKTLAVEDPVAGLKDEAIGAVISTTKLAELEAMPILPATSVWVTTTLWLPWASAVIGVEPPTGIAV